MEASLRLCVSSGRTNISFWELVQVPHSSNQLLFLLILSYISTTFSLFLTVFPCISPTFPLSPPAFAITSGISSLFSKLERCFHMCKLLSICVEPFSSYNKTNISRNLKISKILRKNTILYWLFLNG